VAVVAFGRWIVFEIKDSSCEGGAQHFIICQAKCRIHWHLSLSHRVFFDPDRFFYVENWDNLGFKTFEPGMFCIVSLKQNTCRRFCTQDIQIIHLEELG
jgi:hypothetical protein